jgi:hypothetical protein
MGHGVPMSGRCGLVGVAYAPFTTVVGGNNYARVSLLSNPAQCLIQHIRGYTLIAQSESVIDVAFSPSNRPLCCSHVGGLA